MLVGLLIGTPVGIISGLRPRGASDQAGRVGASLALAIPSFLLGPVLVIIFAVNHNWLPASGYTHFGEDIGDWFQHLVLPCFALGLASAAALARQLRSELIDVLETSYVRTAWAKGGKARLVVVKHALKNAAIPAVTIVGLQVGFLLGGTVIVERIFAIPGMGGYLVTGANSNDLPVVQGVVMVFVVAQLALSLLVDISYGLLNPKVRVR
jgi:peptide/nickel transport system permease protein